MSMKTLFLEHGYMNNNKHRSKVLLKELNSYGIRKPPLINADTRPNKETTIHSQDLPELLSNRRVIICFDRYIRDGRAPLVCLIVI